MPSIRFTLLPIFAFLLAANSAGAQDSGTYTVTARPKAVHIRTVTASATGDDTTIRIDANGPLVPSIGKLENPLQIVIDLPNAAVSDRPKPIDFHSREISAIHMAQLLTVPPLTRIIVDLMQPMAYDWSESRNQLMIHLRGQPAADAHATAAPGTPIPAVPSSRPAALLVNGTPLGAGSSVTAGAEARELSLSRGGAIRVCPGTTLSVTPSRSGSDLLVGMSTGALETNYSLQASADSILTPDFRILLAGPGTFHFAISADPRGNTCVRSLPGNTASAIVTELVGDGSYQVKPTEEVVFHSGQLKLIDSKVPDECGCPVPQPETEVATRGSGSEAAPKSTPTVAETSPLPASQPDDVHVQVDAPLIFHGKPPAPVQDVTAHDAEKLPASGQASAPAIPDAALPPATAASAGTTTAARPPHHSVLGKIGAFFGKLFR